MSQEEHPHPIQRILVALDSSQASLTALIEAVNLAAGFEAQVLGLYVEDINLVRLAQVSFTQEVGLFSGTSRHLEVRYVERQFRGQAGRARQALAALAEPAGVEWSFQVVRGNISRELLRAASDADLIILGRTGASSFAGPRRLGSTARAVMSQAPRLTLVLQRGVRLGTPIFVMYDGSPVAQKALVAAAQILQGQKSFITVLLLSENTEAAQRLQPEAEAGLKAQGITARYLWRNPSNVQSLVHTLQAEGCHTLIIPSDGSELEQETVQTLLDQLDCPVLLVR